MKSLSLLFAALLAVCVVAGCTFMGNQADAPLGIDTVRVDTVCPLLAGRDEPACTVSISLERPATGPDEVLPAVRSFVVGMIRHGELSAAGSDVERAAQLYRDAYVALYQHDGSAELSNYEGDTAAAVRWLSYGENVTGRVTYNAHRLLSYEVQTYSYIGGAHGMYTTNNAVFDIATLSPVALLDVFTYDALPELSAAVQRQLMRDYHVSTLAALQTEGYFFEPSAIAVTDNFGISDQGITFVYDPYEIAPFSSGTIRVTLPWDSVMAYTLPDAPVLRLRDTY